MGGLTGAGHLGHGRPLPHLWHAGETAADAPQAVRGVDLPAGAGRPEDGHTEVSCLLCTVYFMYISSDWNLSSVSKYTHRILDHSFLILF